MAKQRTIEYLEAYGIKASPQRIAVMEYLLMHPTHPTVDVIFNAVSRTMPTLSKATVYNTLRLLVEKGAALQLTIDERSTCYDGNVHPHAHFLCRSCGTVFDFPLTQEQLQLVADIPANFCIDGEELSFYGFCPKCQQENE